MDKKMDTIFALASAQGRAGVAVIRLSGPDVFSVLEKMTGLYNPRPRLATFTPIYTPGAPDDLIDEAVILPFRAPNSFTGEDVVEIHIHGSPVVFDKMAQVFVEHCGLRVALPGEFTRRAFENGKLDLTKAEGIHDLVMAETGAQQKQALKLLRGEQGAVFESLRRDILNILAKAEANIDFSDEEIPKNLDQEAMSAARDTLIQIDGYIDDAASGRRIRSGYSIALIGLPNVGKSSLLNAFAEDDVAIVSETAGTTRDPIEVRLDINGYLVTLIDTAGVRAPDDAIEAEGIKRARKKALDADLRLIIMDATAPLAPDVKIDGDDIIVFNKIDLSKDGKAPNDYMDHNYHCISATNRTGVDGLLTAISKRVTSALSLQESPAVTRERHKVALIEAAGHLRRYIDGNADPALAAEDLRMAARAIGRITGRVDVEDMLDIVFGEFCIGK